MNYNSFKYFSFKHLPKFNKNTFKMMHSGVNKSCYKSMINLHNQIHLMERIVALNNISKKCFGVKAISTGNGLNLSNNPEINSLVLSSAVCDSLSGTGLNLTSNIPALTFMMDYLLLCDGKLNIFYLRAALHVGSAIMLGASDNII